MGRYSFYVLNEDKCFKTPYHSHTPVHSMCFSRPTVYTPYLQEPKVFFFFIPKLFSKKNPVSFHSENLKPFFWSRNGKVEIKKKNEKVIIGLKAFAPSNENVISHTQLYFDDWYHVSRRVRDWIHHKLFHYTPWL